jgi:hypothetical protein
MCFALQRRQAPHSPQWGGRIVRGQELLGAVSAFWGGDVLRRRGGGGFNGRGGYWVWVEGDEMDEAGGGGAPGGGSLGAGGEEASVLQIDVYTHGCACAQSHRHTDTQTYHTTKYFARCDAEPLVLQLCCSRVAAVCAQYRCADVYAHGCIRACTHTHTRKHQPHDTWPG